MKKLIYGTFSLVMLGAIILACEKQNDTEPNKGIESTNNHRSNNNPSVFTMNDVGEYHNQLLDYYYINMNASHNIDDPTSSEMADIYSELYDGLAGIIVMPSNMTKAELIQSLLTFNNYLPFAESQGSNQSQVQICTNYIKSNYPELGDKIQSVIDSELTPSELVISVNSWASSNTFSPMELEAYEVFSDVINNSFIYWTNSNAGFINSGGLSDTQWIILNDGLGTILGLPFGGIGGTILGAAFSAGTADDLDV